MKILTFTTLFPNCKNPDFGIFVKNRMLAVSRFEDVELKVVAPVPWFPPLKISKKWYGYSQIPKYEVIDGIEVYHPRYLVTPKIGMSFYGLWMFLGSLLTVLNIKKNFDFDLLDVHYVYPDGLAGLLLGKTFGKPVTVSARGTDVNLYPQIPIVRNILRSVLRYSNQLISVSGSLGQLMADEGADTHKIKVIPNGIDPIRFYPSSIDKARKHLKLPFGTKILLTVGGLIERKGVHVLIDAVVALTAEGKADFKTYIVGKGEMEPVLREMIKKYNLENSIFLCGHVSNEQLVNWYNAADLFFLGSSREGWPNVVCEALACGTPVVATPVNGIPEILTSDDLGIMVERTPEAFAEGIYHAFSRTWDKALIAETGQQRTWENVAKDVHSLFLEMTDHAKN